MAISRVSSVRRWITISAAILLTLTVAFAGTGSAGSADCGIRPDARLQALIGNISTAKTEAGLDAELLKLKEERDPDFEALIPQLVYFLMHANEGRAAMTPGVIIQRLGITQGQLGKALAPYRGSEDPRLRRQIDNLIGPPH